MASTPDDGAPDAPRSWTNEALERLHAGAEPALLDDVPVVDAHHHLFDWGADRPRKPEHRLAFGRAAGLFKYAVDDLVRDARGLRVVATVHVEANPTDAVGESRECAAAHAATAAAAKRGEGPAVCRGAVVRVDLRKPPSEIDAELDAHAGALAAGGSRLAGVRVQGAYHPKLVSAAPGPGVLLDEAVARGARRLGERNLPVDVWVYHEQIADVAALARASPRTVFVLDHCGGPVLVGSSAAAVFPAWLAAMRALAESAPNVVVKLGGLTMNFALGHARAGTWTSSADLAAALEPWIDAVVDLFPMRAMFETNFPMDKSSVAYPTLWNAFVRVASKRDAVVRRQLLFETANRVYRLGLPTPPLALYEWRALAARAAAGPASKV